MRIRFRAGLAVAVVAVLGLYAAGAAGAPSGKQRALAAGTGVVADVNRGTAGITVPIDLRGPRTVQLKNGRRVSLASLARQWEQTAERRWNAAFARLRYRGLCPDGSRSEPVRLRLDVQFHLGSGHAGHHKIRLSGRDGGHIDRPPGSPRAPSDFSTVYSRPSSGDWGPIDGDVATHEIGHLLGLSDDYRKRNGRVVPITRDGVNRAGTLLANPSGRIDQQLIDRIGKLLAKGAGVEPVCVIHYDVRVQGLARDHYVESGQPDAGANGTIDIETSWTTVIPRLPLRIVRFPRTGSLIMVTVPGLGAPGTLAGSFSFTDARPNNACSGAFNFASLRGLVALSGSVVRGTPSNFHVEAYTDELAELQSRVAAVQTGCPRVQPGQISLPATIFPLGNGLMFQGISVPPDVRFTGEGQGLFTPLDRMSRAQAFTVASGHLTETSDNRCSASCIHHYEMDVTAKFTRSALRRS